MYITPYKCIYDCSLRIHSNVTTQPRYQRGPHPLDVDIRWKRDYAQSLDTSSLHRNASTQRISQRPIGRSDTPSHGLYPTRPQQLYQPRPFCHTHLTSQAAAQIDVSFDDDHADSHHQSNCDIQCLAEIVYLSNAFILRALLSVK